MFTWQEVLKLFIVTFLIAFALGYTTCRVQEVKEAAVCEAKQL